MSYLYLLAGENLGLSKAEVEGFLKSQREEAKLKRAGKLLESGCEPSQLKRLAMVHEVSLKLEELDLENPEPNYRPETSFAVRTIDAREDGEALERRELEEELGAELENTENYVDLESPEEQLRAYILDGKIVLGKLVEDLPRGLFEERKNHERPFSSPVSLNPVIARLLVNLSEVPAGGSLLDPFCGTGGILIEAGLCGVEVFGLDAQERMVEGARENLEAFGIIDHEIRKGEIRNLEGIFDRKFDALVTDLPYGKASKLEGEPVNEFFESAPEIANKIVFMSDQDELNDLEPEFELYVHKNLTRYIYII